MASTPLFCPRGALSPRRLRCRRGLGAMAILVVVLTVLTPTATRAELVRVAVASSFRPTLVMLAEDFRAETGHDLRLSAASSGVLAAQILSGAPFDVLLSADTARPLLLERAELTVPDSRFSYAHGRLALISAAGEPPWPMDVASISVRLAALPVRSVALPDPALAPIGVAAQEMLQALGLWRPLAMGLVRGWSAAHVLHLVHSGAVPVGVVSLAQARLLPALAHWPVPAALHQPVEQQAVLLRPGNAGAAELLHFLRHDEVRQYLLQAGYALPPAAVE